MADKPTASEVADEIERLQALVGKPLMDAGLKAAIAVLTNIKSNAWVAGEYVHEPMYVFDMAINAREWLQGNEESPTSQLKYEPPEEPTCSS